MPLTPVAGIERLRSFQLGKESTFKTQVPATRRLPWKYMPTTDPHWTFPTADTGTIDEAIAPYKTALDLTGQATGQLFANDAPSLFSALVKGGVTPSNTGTAYTWTYQPASTSQDSYDTFTGEWSDDYAGDAFAYMGGIVDKLQLTYPQDLGPITFQADWRFASLASYPATPTGALAVDLAPTPLFAADTALYLDDNAGAIGISQVLDTMYDGSLTISNNTDVKRMMNGSNTRYQVTGYSRGPRTLEFSVTLAKSAKEAAEVAKWLNDSPQERFVRLDTTSTALANAGLPYRMSISFGGFWFTRTDGTVNSNTSVQLVCRGIYDTTLGYPYKVTVVNTRATL